MCVLKMKSFALVLLTLIAFVVCDMRPEFKRLLQPCMKQENVTEADLTAFYDGGMKPIDVTDKIKCHMRCIMEKEGFLKNGTFLEGALLQALKENPEMKNYPNVEKSMSECKGEKGPNDCETAYLITMCIINNKANWD